MSIGMARRIVDLQMSMLGHAGGGRLGGRAEEGLRRLYEISQSVFPVPKSTPFRLSQ